MTATDKMLFPVAAPCGRFLLVTKARTTLDNASSDASLNIVRRYPSVRALELLRLAMNVVAVVVCRQGRVMLRAKRQLVQTTRIATVREIWPLMNKLVLPAR